METNGLELATWALVFVTGGLLLATVSYVIVTIMNYKASKDHTDALKKQVEALLAINQTFANAFPSLNSLAGQLQGLRR